MGAGIYAAGLVLVVPITIIAFIIHLLSLGYVKTSSISGGANSLLYEATTIIPLVSVAILRQCAPSDAGLNPIEAWQT